MTDIAGRALGTSLAAVTEAPRVDPRRAVVVGVDGSERNRAAVRWATHEAEASARPLHLVCVLDDEVPIPHHSAATDDDRDWTLLRRLAADIALERPELTVDHELVAGGAIGALVAHSADRALLVVGKRGLGTFARLLIGSTSIAVAGRSRVPTVIVPDTWDQARHGHDPVVVGLDPDDVHAEALAYAFAEARRRGVRLVIAHGWEAKGLLIRDPAAVSRDIASWKEHCLARLTDVVGPARSSYPGVHVELVPRHGHPATVLLEVAESAQLLVLGRHDDSRLGGFPFGSVTRNVLHHAEVPVAVVPSALRS